jgi:hypothetical protein
MRSARPHGTAARMPWPFISNTFVNDGTVAERKYAPGRAGILLCGRAEPAPPRNGQAMRSRPCGGSPGDNVEGGFLGGMRSARPHGKGVLKPRHNMIIGGERTPGGLMGRSSRWKRSLLCGRAEPAAPGGHPPDIDGLTGANPGTARKAVFRRGAVFAPGWYGITRAEGYRYPGGVTGEAISLLRISGSSLGFFCGRAEPGLALPWNPN